MKIKNDMVVDVIKSPTVNVKIYFSKNLIAIDCSSIKTYMRYFYISQKEVIENADKWNEFATKHLSLEIKNGVEQFAKRVTNLLVFI